MEGWWYGGMFVGNGGGWVVRSKALGKLFVVEWVYGYDWGLWGE